MLMLRACNVPCTQVTGPRQNMIIIIHQNISTSLDKSGRTGRPSGLHATYRIGFRQFLNVDQGSDFGAENEKPKAKHTGLNSPSVRAEVRGRK